MLSDAIRRLRTRVVLAPRRAYVWWFRPYTVHTSWAHAVHEAATFNEAIQWCKCYGAAEVCTIKHRGIAIATRYGRATGLPWCEANVVVR